MNSLRNLIIIFMQLQENTQIIQTRNEPKYGQYSGSWWLSFNTNLSTWAESVLLQICFG